MKRLDTLLTSYSIHVITALITLPTLIWHISSTHIHDDYDMPDDWTEEFNKVQFTGGRGLLWAFLFVLVGLSVGGHTRHVARRIRNTQTFPKAPRRIIGIGDHLS